MQPDNFRFLLYWLGLFLIVLLVFATVTGDSANKDVVYKLASGAVTTAIGFGFGRITNGRKE